MGKFLPDRTPLLDALAAERAAGKRVVFTNGVFDMLHAGHVRSLQGAASFGDVLVVGINDDASVRRLKGERRPIVPLAQRGEVVAALQAVTFATAFSEDTPEELIKAVKPDVLVKGKDYEGKVVVGEEFVRKNGGRVELIPLVPGVSTSDVVEEILRRYRAD